MAFSIEEYLRHILDETDFLGHQSALMDFETFMNDEGAKRSFVRSLEVIGEAVKHISQDHRSRHPDIKWRSIAGMRDKLIHEYFGVDYEIVWDAVTNKIPALGESVRQMLLKSTLD